MIAVSAVVLAAGLSSRMGGPHKLLLDVGGEPMLRRVVRSVLGLPPTEVIVVTGHRAPEIRAALDGLALRFTHNAGFAAGQPGSVIAGVRALAGFCDAVMIVLGDQPLLTTAGLRRMVDCYQMLPAGRSILVPTSGGARGNPVLFAAHHIPAIRTGAMKLGGGGLIDAYPEQVALFDLADESFVRDCDTPDDYAALRARITMPGQNG